MLNQTNTILRQSKRNIKKLNILDFITHERFQEGISKTGHEFWMWRQPRYKKWISHYAKLPKNFHLLDEKLERRQIPEWLDIDLVMSQNKEVHFGTAFEISKRLRCPLLSLEHTLPHPALSRAYIKKLHDMRGDINIFVSEFNREAWGYPPDFGYVINTGIDTETFRPLGLERTGHVLSINNDWIRRDIFCGFELWKQITGFPDQRVFPLQVFGDTPGLSRGALDTDEIVKAYNTASVYLNTTTWSTLPTTIIEAMACECPVVSTATCLIPKIMIEHGVNGFVSNDPIQLREYTIMLLQDKKLAEKIGKAGRETVLKKFSLERFVNDWNKVFYEATEMRPLG